MYFIQSLDGDTFSVIENPAAVGHSFHSENAAGVTVTKGVSGWFKGIQSVNHGKDLSWIERHRHYAPNHTTESGVIRHEAAMWQHRNGTADI